MTVIWLFTSINEEEWPHCPWNGRNNINGTATDPAGFVRHAKTLEMQKIYIRNMVRKFDNENVIWRIAPDIPEIFKAGKREKRLKQLIPLFLGEGVPYNRMAIEYAGIGSKVFFFLDLGIWSHCPGINSQKSVERYHRTVERWGMREDEETGNPRYSLGTGLGADLLDGARGLGDAESRKASSWQMYDMLLFDLTHGKTPHPWILTSGPGILFISAAGYAFEGGRFPNLRNAIRIGTEGLTELECQALRVGYDENKRPELNAIFQAYTDSQK